MVIQISPHSLFFPTHPDGGVKDASVPETSSEDILNKYRDLGKARSNDHLEANEDSITGNDLYYDHFQFSHLVTNTPFLNSLIRIEAALSRKSFSL